MWIRWTPGHTLVWGPSRRENPPSTFWLAVNVATYARCMPHRHVEAVHRHVPANSAFAADSPEERLTQEWIEGAGSDRVPLKDLLVEYPSSIDLDDRP